MKLLTRQTLADTAPERWARQYRGETKDWLVEVAAKLGALAPPINPDEVDAIIGNDSWTTPESCSECDNYEAIVIEVGQPLDYDSATAWLCVSCLQKALAMIGGDA